MTGVADIFRRTLLFGIGAISLTAERAQEFANDLVERGEITREQGVSMVQELTRRGTEARKQFREAVRVEVRKALDEAKVPSESDIKRLEDKIDRLILMQKQAQMESEEESGKASPEAV